MQSDQISSTDSVHGQHQQKLDRVHKQALRIITVAMRSTPIEKMEYVVDIVPLNKRRDSRLMIQATKFKYLLQHPMNKRMNDYPCKRHKRTSFYKQSKSLLRQHKELPHTSTKLALSTASHCGNHDWTI